MLSKNFHIGDILSITTEKLVSPRKIKAVYEILNFMTGEDIFTHQLSDFADICKPFLIQQMPWLAEITAEEVNEENWESWLTDIGKKYGEMHLVKQICI